MEAILNAAQAVANQPNTHDLPEIPVAQWQPDRPDYLGGAVEAKNVIGIGPVRDGDRPSYRPVKAFSAVSTTAMTARCQGIASASDTDNFTHTYGADATKVYRLLDAVWTDASAAGYVGPAEHEWVEFIKAGDTILACHIDEEVQGVTVGGETFADQFTSTLKPNARHMAKVGRFLMLGNVDESGRKPNRYRWGAIDSLVDMDASAANQSGSRDVREDLGWIQRIFSGGEYGIGFHQSGIVRIQYEGPPTVFRFDAFEENQGLVAPYAVARHGSTYYFRSADGFYAMENFRVRPIADVLVNKYFLDNADPALYHRITAALDLDLQCVVFAYTSNDAVTSDADKMLIYHWPSGWWSHADIALELVANIIKPGTTLDGLDSISTDIDAGVLLSFDSPPYSGQGVIQFGGVNTSHQSGTFSGATLAATVDTTELGLFPGRRAMMVGARPIADGGTITMKVAGRDRMNDAAPTYSSAAAQSADGVCPLRKVARYHKLRVDIAASGTWTHISGVQPIGAPVGYRG